MAEDRVRVRDLAAATPASRDRYVDFLRAFAIVMVVVGHWLAVMITFRDGRLGGEHVLAVLMVGVPGAEVQNTSPPTVALLALAVAHTGLVLMPAVTMSDGVRPHEAAPIPLPQGLESASPGVTSSSRGDGSTASASAGNIGLVGVM
jgi:hypothetical protein